MSSSDKTIKLPCDLREQSLMRLIGEMLEAQEQEQEQKARSKRPRVENVVAELRDEEAMPLQGDDDEEAYVNVLIILPSGRCFMHTAWCYDTINNVKAKIEEKEGIPRSRQVLLHEGRVLGDFTLRFLRMNEGEVIVVTTTSPEASDVSASSSSSAPSSSTTTTTTMADRLLTEAKALRKALQTVQKAAAQNGVHDMLFIDGDEQAP
jgi:hypothetical protein